MSLKCKKVEGISVTFWIVLSKSGYSAACIVTRHFEIQNAMVTCDCFKICLTSHEIHLFVDGPFFEVHRQKPKEASKAYTCTFRISWVYQNNSGAVPPLPVLSSTASFP